MPCNRAPRHSPRCKAASCKLFVLAEDAQARAIEVPDWAEAIDYPAFVELSIHHDKVNSWL